MQVNNIPNTTQLLNDELQNTKELHNVYDVHKLIDSCLTTQEVFNNMKVMISEMGENFLPKNADHILAKFNHSEYAKKLVDVLHDMNIYYNTPHIQKNGPYQRNLGLDDGFFVREVCELERQKGNHYVLVNVGEGCHRDVLQNITFVKYGSPRESLDNLIKSKELDSHIKLYAINDFVQQRYPLGEKDRMDLAIEQAKTPQEVYNNIEPYIRETNFRYYPEHSEQILKKFGNSEDARKVVDHLEDAALYYTSSIEHYEKNRKNFNLDISLRDNRVKSELISRSSKALNDGYTHALITSFHEKGNEHRFNVNDNHVSFHFSESDATNAKEEWSKALQEGMAMPFDKIEVKSIPSFLEQDLGVKSTITKENTTKVNLDANPLYNKEAENPFIDAMFDEIDNGALSSRKLNANMADLVTNYEAQVTQANQHFNNNIKSIKL